jgi:hypothetical protein
MGIRWVLSALPFYLLVAPAAQAGWLAPVDLSAASQHIGGSHVVLDSAGNATAVWDRWNGTDTVVESAYRPAGEGWQAPIDLSSAEEPEGEGEGEVLGAHDAQSPRIAVDGDGNVTVVWERYAGTNRILVQAVDRPEGGSWGSPVDIGEVKTMSAPEPWLAVDEAGDATVVWTSGDVIVSGYRPAGGSWQAAVPISGADSYGPQAAVDAQGDATAVWMHFDGSDYVVQSAYRPAAGSWEAPSVVSESGEEGGNPHIALGAQGDVMVVWRGETGGEEAARASYKPVEGSWQPPTAVSVPGDQVQSLHVALDASGDALVVWADSTNELGSYTIAKAAFLPAGGSWEAPVELSEDGGNSFPLDVVFDTSGNAAVVWERSNEGQSIVQADYRPAGGSWQEATDLSEEGKSAMEAVVVLDAPGDATAADGDATAIWTSAENIPCGSDPKCEKSYSYTVQAAGYDTYGHPSERLDVPAESSVGTEVEVSIPPVDIWAPVVEFGDGAVAYGTSATHVYGEPGEYEVTFWSTNVLGYRTSAQRTIAIGPEGGSAEPEPEPEPEPEAEPEPEDENEGDSPSSEGGSGNPSDEISAPVSGPSASSSVSTGGSPSAECATAEAALKNARRQLWLTRARLRQRYSLSEGARLKSRSRRQAATLRRTSRRAREACES